MTKDEGLAFLEKLNAQFPKQIRFTSDGFYERYLIIKAKNYATKSGDKLTIKGGSLRSNAREPALREFLERVLITIMNDEPSKIAMIYREYENEIENLQDPKRWAARKTVTEKILNPIGTHERKIFDAIQGLGLGLGDKVWVLFRADGSLVPVEKWQGDHCQERLKEKLKKTFEIVKGVVK